MSCILYDKDGNEQRVRAEYVSGMLMRGYTSTLKPQKQDKPVKKTEDKPIKKAEKPLELNLDS